MADPKPLVIESLTGGYDDTSSPNELDPDKCTLANNVEFWNASMGERRRGCEPLNVIGSGLEDEDAVVFICEWFPDGGTTEPQWFVVAATPGSSVSVAVRDSAGTWTAVTVDDPILTTEPGIYQIQACALNGKLFLAYPSTEDRTHVWDGTYLRRTGLAEPDAPGVATEGSGTYNTIRYFRVREVIRDGDGNVLVRSEPSETVAFTPPGTGAGARITRATYTERATDWEVEASNDDADYYRIATVAQGTTTYDDETAGGNPTNAIPAGLAIPPGYVQLSNRAQILNMTGTMPHGAYSNGTTFPIRGWVMYTSAGAYIAEGWTGHQPPVAGDVTFASQDVALSLEEAAGEISAYSDIGELSEAIGSYLTQGNVKFLGSVDDRLILGGHFSDIERQSSVYWTPVHNDPGEGNDERLPLATDNSQSLDNGQGGPVTAITPGVNGSWYVFKYEHIYKANPTRQAIRAYTFLTLSTVRGAVEGSVFPGLDQDGTACLFLMDPHIGPCMLGAGGLLQIIGLRNTWMRVNLAADNIVARGCYYPAKEQAHWWVAIDGADVPNYKLVLQVGELQRVDQGAVHRGWATWTGRVTEALCVGVLSEVVSEDSTTYLRKRPFIGLDSEDLLQRCDSHTTTDAGVSFRARIRTKPFFSAGLMSNWGGMFASAFVAAVEDTTMFFQLIRDMGQESSTQAEISLDPGAASVDYLVKDMDDLVMSESRSIQVEYGDE